MMNNGDPFDPRLRKQEEMLVDERAKETKPAVKTLNRVPRTCPSSLSRAFTYLPVLQVPA